MKLEKIDKIISNLELLIDGIDPSSGLKITVDTILNSRKNNQILKEACQVLSEYATQLDKRRKLDFHLEDSQKKEIFISEKPISISKFTYAINEFVDSKVMKKIKAYEITAWLKYKGYLKEIEHDDGKIFKTLTDKANEIGMLKETKTSSYGRNYEVNLYSAKTQKFIIDNLNSICQFIRSKHINT